jgi:glycosyltransferase involved in cell wall biosynthesis
MAELAGSARSAQETDGVRPAIVEPAARPVRALFINDTSRNGGPGRTLFYILNFLDPAVIRRSVMVPREGVVTELLRRGRATEELFVEPNFIENLVEPWSRPMVRQDFEAPVALRAVRAAGNVGRAASAMVSLARRIERERFEVIFCNGTSANFAGGALSALTAVPAIWHVFYTSLARPIRGLHNRLAASRGVRSILCVSQPTARRFDHCRHKVRIVGDSIDCDEYDPSRIEPRLRAELRIDATAVVFGSQGRVLPRKGFVEMIRAARIAVDAMTKSESAACRFVVYGDTPEDMRPNHLEQCRALVKELRLDGVFQFVGYRPDVKPYVVDFDVAIVPSVYEDPLPRAVIEAMALGKPVLAFAVGGIPEIVEHGVSGTLVSGSPPDVHALAREMLRYLRDPALRGGHGAAARERILRRHEARAHAHGLQSEIVAVARG